MITMTSNGQLRAPYRQVQTLPNESFRLIEVSGPQSGCSWHFHPEHQLGFVIQGTGERVVGDSVCPIHPGEVVLLGANLPHVWHYQGGGPR
jgi:quercetin dioxygenase-like cupin family protein